jgi:putative multiple sugar transport system substrate-binding protein
MKKNLLFLLSLLVIASMVLAACGQPATEEAAGSELAVGIVLPTKDEPRWVQDETRFKEALTAAGYDVEILFSQGDSAKEKTNVESLIAKGVKVIILTPHDGAAAAAAAEAARAAGVKVISYDRLIRDTEAVDFYVTFDSISVGAAQAQYLVDKAEGTGNPLYLYAGAASDNNAFLFFEGAWNVLQPKIADGTFVIANSSEAEALKDKATLTRDEQAAIIGQVTTNWDFNTAKTLAESNLTDNGADAKGDVFILAPNDGTARAIADAFAADADVTSYVVTGQDAEKASVQYIIDGKQSMTVFKDVRTLVDDAITAAKTFLEGGTPEATNSYNNGKIDVPANPTVVITVDKDNVQSALIDSGYYSASDFTGLGESSAPSGEVVEVTFWHAYGTGSAEEIALAGILEQAAVDLPQYKINVLQVPFNDIFNKYDTDVAAGGGPDMFIAPNDNLGGQARAGTIADITDLAAGKLGDYSELSQGGMMYDGKLYGIPESLKAVAFWYNTDMLPEAPATTDDLKALMEGGTPVAISFGCYHHWGFFGSFGGQIFDDQFNFVADEANQANVAAAMSYLNDLYQISVENGWPRNDSDGLAPFTEGTVAAITNGNWAMGDYRNALGDKLAVAPIPAGPGGASNPLLGVDGFYFNPNSENQEAALEVALYLTGTAAQQVMMDEAGHVPANTTVDVTDPLIQGLLDAFSTAYFRPQVEAMGNYWGNFCGTDQVFDAGTPAADWVKTAFEGATK